MKSYIKSPLKCLSRSFQYKLDIEECSRPLKGKVDIPIGTVRSKELKECEIASEMSNLSVNGMGPRSMSMMSCISGDSVVTAPPNYSALSSRSTSIASFETRECYYKLNTLVAHKKYRGLRNMILSSLYSFYYSTTSLQ